MTTPHLDSLRKDLKHRMAETGTSQVDLQKLTFIQQSSLSFFLTGKRGLSFSNVIRLWPFVYGTEFPHIPQPPESTIPQPALPEN